jgi:nitroreductase
MLEAMTPEEFRLVVEFASLAPSVHNTQPWRFVAGDDGLEIYAEPDRQLQYLDPSGRQLHISCGAVVEFARIAIRAMGFDCDVDLLPDAADRELVARIRAGSQSTPTEAELALVAAAARRYTDRGPYSDEELTSEQIERLRVAAASAGCWLRALSHRDERVAAITLLAEAERAEAADPEYRAELEKWQRRQRSPDGIPQAAHASWDEQERVSDVPLRDFTGHDWHPLPHEGVPPEVERDALLLIGTTTDSESSWLQAGRAIGLVLLTLTDDNLVCQPLGPVLDVPATRERLRRELRLLGQPQLMLRAGHGAGRPQTGRRAVEDILRLAGSS